MHEYSIAKNLAYIIFKEINDKKPKIVNKIIFVIGKASGIDKEFLEHSFKEHIFKNTICENAQLEFVFEEPRIKCKRCGKEYSDKIIKCDCGGEDFDIIAGDQVYVKEIEIE